MDAIIIIANIGDLIIGPFLLGCAAAAILGIFPINRIAGVGFALGGLVHVLKFLGLFFRDVEILYSHSWMMMAFRYLTCVLIVYSIFKIHRFSGTVFLILLMAAVGGISALFAFLLRLLQLLPWEGWMVFPDLAESFGILVTCGIAVFACFENKR